MTKTATILDCIKESAAGLLMSGCRFDFNWVFDGGAPSDVDSDSGGVDRGGGGVRRR
jgi:hypothetical protein